MINGDQETFFLSELYDKLLDFQLLDVLHHMGMDRWVPIVIFILMSYKHGLSMYHDDLLESLPLLVLHCVGMDRRGPPINVCLLT